MFGTYENHRRLTAEGLSLPYLIWSEALFAGDPSENMLLFPLGAPHKIALGPVHTLHFCRVEFNSIKCGRNVAADSYVKFLPNLIL